MKKIFFAILLVVCMAVPAMADTVLSKDFTLQGEVSMGYVFADDFSTEVNGAIPPDVEGNDTGSKWGYLVDLRIVYRNMIRPFIYLQGISGYGVNNEWAVVTQTFTAGVDYLFYTTKYGQAFIRGSYTNWKTEADIDFMGLPVNAKPESDTWMMSLGWKF